MNSKSQIRSDNVVGDVEPLANTPSVGLRRAQEERLLRTWQTPRGWRYWSSVNNSDVGLWYTAMAFVFFLFAGVLALLIRIQLAVPNNTVLSADFYNQAFTVHGSVMMFLFALPIFEAIAILLLPQMLGARDLPFPRLSAFVKQCGDPFTCTTARSPRTTVLSDVAVTSLSWLTVTFAGGDINMTRAISRSLVRSLGR